MYELVKQDVRTTFDLLSGRLGNTDVTVQNTAYLFPAEIQQRFRRKKMDWETQTKLVLSAVHTNNIINIEGFIGYCEYRLFSNGSKSRVENITESPHMWQKIRIYSNPCIISFLHAILPLWSAQTR